jgi:hypothetical protein
MFCGRVWLVMFLLGGGCWASWAVASSTTSTATATASASAMSKDEVLKILESRNRPDVNARLVAKTIEKLRATKEDWAYMALAECLDWKDPASQPTGLPYVRVDYPAVASLIDVGKPCIPAVISAISKSGRSNRLTENGLFVISHVEGNKSATTDEVAKVLKTFAAKYEQAGKVDEAIRLLELAKPYDTTSTQKTTTTSATSSQPK